MFTFVLTKLILSCFTKSPWFFALAALALAANSQISWAAESLRFGFSGATATQLAGAIAVEQKLFALHGVNVEFTQSAGTTMIPPGACPPPRGPRRARGDG